MGGSGTITPGSANNASYNQQRIFQGGMQMTSAAHSKNSSQKRTKINHGGSNAGSGSGGQQQ